MPDTEILDAVDQSREEHAPITTAETESSESADTQVDSPAADSADSSRARDEKGRYAAAMDEAREGEPEVEEVAAPVAVAETEKPAAAAAAPFTVRALGADYALDGATIQPDGSAIFAPEAVQRAHQLFGRAILINKRAAEVEQDRATLRAAKAAIEAYNKPLEEQWEKLKVAQTVEEFTEIAAGMWLERAVIDRERGIAKREAELTVRQEPPQVHPDEQRDAIEREVDGSIRETFAELKAAPWAKGLTAEDWKDLETDVRATRGAYLVRGDDGLYYNGPEVTAFVQRQAARLTRERDRVNATTRQAAAAARKNAGATVGAVSAPPGVGTSGGPRKTAPAAASPARSRAATTTADRRAEREKFERWVQTGKDD